MAEVFLFKALLHNGLHPNGKGHHRIYEQVRSFITEHFGLCD